MLTSARFLSLRPIVWVGEISYSLYLWHWPIWVLFNYLEEGRQLTWMNKAFYVLLTFVLAQISTIHIEDPIRNKKIVITSKLWRGFGVVWVCFMLFLMINIQQDIGGRVPAEDTDR